MSAVPAAMKQARCGTLTLFYSVRHSGYKKLSEPKMSTREKAFWAFSRALLREGLDTPETNTFHNVREVEEKGEEAEAAASGQAALTGTCRAVVWMGAVRAVRAGFWTAATTGLPSVFSVVRTRESVLMI